jgi:hypothetical protein
LTRRGAQPWVTGAVLVALAGCAGSAGVLQGVPTTGTDGSWIDPASTKQNLLYITDEAVRAVDVFTYPYGKPSGVLQLLHTPAGICSSKAGDVWIVNSPTHVYEYAHGAKQPEAMLEDTGALELQSCAVSPVNGDLAVVDAGHAIEAGSVAVFAGAKGTPHRYRSTDLHEVFFCAYDAHGNLFVDGLDANYTFHLMQLAHGARKLQAVKLDQSIGFPGALAWDGKYLALGDRLYQGKHETAIYQISVSGAQGTITGTTRLGGSCDLLGFAVPKLGSGKGNPQATRVVAPDACDNTVRFYAYPAGGAPLKNFGTLQYPFSATVSQAH